MLRKIVATVVGVLVAGLVVALVESINRFLAPHPQGIDLHDMKQVAAMIAKLPTQAFLVVLAAWSLGALIGSWVATRLAGRSTVVPGIIVGVFILAGAIFNIAMFPHPLWMITAGLLLPVPSALLGARLALGKPS